VHLLLVKALRSASRGLLLRSEVGVQMFMEIGQISLRDKVICLHIKLFAQSSSLNPGRIRSSEY
jgi:hypothetical protein